jgi:membrane protease YdiL (CAAX protease family)
MALAGLLFCYVVHRTGTIVYGLIAHMVNNAILIAIDALRALL